MLLARSTIRWWAPDSLALLRGNLAPDGDHRLDMKLSDAELQRRGAVWQPSTQWYPRGYGQLFSHRVKQANEGCDFDFLEGIARIPDLEIH